jgi:flagellin
MSNLTVTSTNLSSFESSIRDVDLATETVDFTRNQILIQAGTAQLAQAKALPQQALQLLG